MNLVGCFQSDLILQWSEILGRRIGSWSLDEDTFWHDSLTCSIERLAAEPRPVCQLQSHQIDSPATVLRD